MQGDRAAVQAVLDQVRAEGRTALTAPEGKQVCEAYGIPVPQEGLATSAPRQHVWHRRLAIRSC